MRRNAFRPLWVILALLLLLEAWLWDHLEPIVARVVNIFPWGRVKIAVARAIENLPPYQIWNRWWLLAAFLTCITTEWIFRKRKGML